MKRKVAHVKPAKKPAISAHTGWSAVKVADEFTGEVSVYFTFPTTSGQSRCHKFAKTETDDVAKMILALRGYEAVFPVAENGRGAFIRTLLPSDESKPLQGTRRPGFTETGKGFVLGQVMLGDAEGQKFFLGDVGPESLGDAAGSSPEYKKLTSLLQYTSFGTLGVLTMLGSAIPKYLRLRGKDVKGAAGLVPETCTFNFAATSGAGKTLPSRIAASVSGSPNNHGTWEGSRRGQEEYLHSRNEVGAIFDDLEKTTEKHLNLKGRIDIINQCVPAGRSKVIAASSRKKDLPALTWQTFALSSSPRPIDAVVADFRKPERRSNGEKLRLIDLIVPGTEEGGFVDERPAGKNPVEFGIKIANDLEEILNNNYGHLFGEFVSKLIKMDLASKIVELTEYFVKQVAPGGDSYDIRFAKKFGILYAAGKILEHYKLVDWPVGWALKAVKRCYDNARSAANVVHGVEKQFAPRAVLLRLMQGFNDGRFVDTRRAKKRPIIIADEFGLIVRPRGGKEYLGVFDDALGAYVITQQDRNILTEFLTKHSLYDGGHGSARTAQESIVIEKNGLLVPKPRVWRINYEEFLKLYRAAVKSGEVSKGVQEWP